MWAMCVVSSRCPVYFPLIVQIRLALQQTGQRDETIHIAHIALHLVYSSNTTRAMHGTEVRQAPGRFHCGITTVSALKVSRTSLTKIIGPEPLRDNQFCGPESPSIRAGLISGSPRPYSLARKIKKYLQLFICMVFYKKKLLQQLIKKDYQPPSIS